MAVTHYNLSLLKLDDYTLRFTPEQLCVLLKAWRNGQETSDTCSTCRSQINFIKDTHFAVCCNRFYYRPTTCYPITSIAVETPGYVFALRELSMMVAKKCIRTNQEFLVLPDPIYWQVSSTLIYEKTMKFVRGLPMTKRTQHVQPISKTPSFYDQVQKAPLNHGSIFRRSGGKNTLFRQIAFGKRCTMSMRATIVPDAQLRPDEIAIPESIEKSFSLLGKWIILNRMPSLQPENFVALRVAKIWKHDCFGIPIEVAEQMHADFDGDECNLIIVLNEQSQAECFMVLNSKHNMGSYTSGLKLNPGQDMLVAYYLFYDRIDFLPYKNKKSLKKTFRVLFDLYGSEKTFEYIDRMRSFYLEAMERYIVFGLTLREIKWLVESAKDTNFEKFCQVVKDAKSCLVTQVKAEAKGSYYHLYQMFGSLGIQGCFNVKGSFWKGLTASEAVVHSITAFDAMQRSSRIWEPGYGYSKSVYNLQGLSVDYLGRLTDGNVVVENDVMDVLHHTDIMSEDSFSELLRTQLMVK